MREARTLASWVLALFVAVVLVWIAAESIAPQPPAKNHLFEVFRESSGIAYFEPTGRFVFGAVSIIVAVFVLIPPTRRIGAVLAALIMAALAALVGQLVMNGIQVPVDTITATGEVSTSDTDPSALLYLVIGLLAASVALIFVHPGKSRE